MEGRDQAGGGGGGGAYAPGRGAHVKGRYQAARGGWGDPSRGWISKKEVRFLISRLEIAISSGRPRGRLKSGVGSDLGFLL